MTPSQLEALIQREAEKPPYMRHGYAVDTMATGNFKAGASLLAPALIEALGALEWYNDSGKPEDEGTPGAIYHKAGLHKRADQALQRIKELLGEK